MPREHRSFTLPPAPQPSTTSQWDARASTVTELTWAKNKILTGTSVAVCFAKCSSISPRWGIRSHLGRTRASHEPPALPIWESGGCPGLERIILTELKHSRDPGVRSKYLTMLRTGFGVYFFLYFNFLKRIQWQKITFPLLKVNGSPWKMFQVELTQDQLCPGAASVQPVWVQVTCHSLSDQLVRTGMDQAVDPAGASWAELETSAQHQPQ